jgi:hypothetical protein
MDLEKEGGRDHRDSRHWDELQNGMAQMVLVQAQSAADPRPRKLAPSSLPHHTNFWIPHFSRVASRRHINYSLLQLSTLPIVLPTRYLYLDVVLLLQSFPTAHKLGCMSRGS